ncbi:putative receptor-like protein kinase At2g23200 [Bidens hawaiensis]|uniref:putative receptor-like protein kinase At2g23200 n=1 Tax=Bidens hawaiensis TaxID=980011 RepID=UPI004049D575
MSHLKDFDHLRIPLEGVVSVTSNFDPSNVIGSVYKGELSLPKGQITTILVYEYASRGSLDRYLANSSTLSWMQRLKICVGAARGLRFLHDPKGRRQRVLHRDVKSGNILLDEKRTANVSDFGLAKVGLANQAHTYLISIGVGTPGYCDPLYLELVPEWKLCYEDNKLDDIILPGLKEQMDPGSLISFSAIAYQCLEKVHEDRPTMAKIEVFESSQRGRTSLMLNDQTRFQDRADDYAQPQPVSDGDQSFDSQVIMSREKNIDEFT